VTHPPAVLGGELLEDLVTALDRLVDLDPASLGDATSVRLLASQV